MALNLEIQSMLMSIIGEIIMSIFMKSFSAKEQWNDEITLIQTAKNPEQLLLRIQDFKDAFIHLYSLNAYNVDGLKELINGIVSRKLHMPNKIQELILHRAVVKDRQVARSGAKDVKVLKILEEIELCTQELLEKCSGKEFNSNRHFAKEIEREATIVSGWFIRRACLTDYVL